MVVADAGKSLSYRFDYWRGAVTLIGAQPWTGYGVANFQQNYNRIKVVTASESPADPHSFILETAVAGGLPLLAILIAILVILFLRMIDVSSVDAAPKSPFAATDSVVDNSNLAILFGALSGCMGIMLFESLVSDTDAIISSFLFVGVTLLVGAAVVRRQWFSDDANSVATCLISVLGILIHLLASGGWMQPGIMNSFCVLVGLAFGIRARQSIESKSMLAAGSHSQWKKTRIIPVACLLIVVVMAVDFARTMCLPVLAASGVKSLIANDPDSVLDPNQWLEIIQLDPLDPELPSLAASQLVELLLKNNLSDSSKHKYAALFDACCENYLKRDANQWMPYAECGRWNAILADNETTAATDAIFGKSRKELAYQYFLRSTELYPNSAQTQLQAAVIAVWCGKLQESRLHVSKAEDIDRETPHADRKLSAAVVVFPKQLESAFGPLEVRESLSHPGYSKGEPIMEWLRTKVR